jgi:hypothetical protein
MLGKGAKLKGAPFAAHLPARVKSCRALDGCCCTATMPKMLDGTAAGFQSFEGEQPQVGASMARTKRSKTSDQSRRFRDEAVELPYALPGRHEDH